MCLLAMALISAAATTGALRFESTTLGFVDPEYPAVAHYEVVSALVAAAKSGPAAGSSGPGAAAIARLIHTSAYGIHHLAGAGARTLETLLVGLAHA